MKTREPTVTTPQPRIEAWERAKINKLMWMAMATGFGSMLVGGLISLLLATIGVGEFSYGMLLFAWILLPVFIVPKAYHEGVCNERQRGKMNTRIQGDDTNV